MNDTPRSEPAETRTPWVAPLVQTIAAGDAEEGTRDQQDGQFTTS